MRGHLAFAVGFGFWRGMSHRTLTLIDAGQPLTVEAVVHGDAIRVSTDALQQALGWELKPEGLYRAGTCVPVRERAALVHEDGIDLAALARLLDRPLAMEADEGIAGLGASATGRAHGPPSMGAPDF